MALTKVSGEVITRPLVLTGNASVSGIMTVATVMTVGIGSTTTTIDGSQDFPTIRPTLDLNFAATKTLDRRITFTRDSIGTYTDELGIVRTAPNNVPRFDHDPDTGESLGLLIEESRENLVLYSVELTQANWIKTRLPISSASSEVAPDGTVGDVVIATASADVNSDHYAYTNNTYSGRICTTSAWFKNQSTTTYFPQLRIVGAGSGQAYATFNLSGNGSIPESGGAIYISSSITPYPNGWYRCTMTFDSTSYGSSYLGGIIISNSTSSGELPLFTGSGSTADGFLVWGFQNETGSFATSYIPTSGSTVTRAADFAKITGTNFTGFYNTLEGTLYSSFIRKPASNRFLVGLGYDSSNYIAMGYTVDTNDMYIQPLISSLNGLTSVGGNVRSKSIISYNSSGASGSINGNSVVSETASGGLPSGSNGALYIGTSPFDPSVICTGTISSVVYYNKRLTNAQLQSLTRQ